MEAKSVCKHLLKATVVGNWKVNTISFTVSSGLCHRCS